MPHKPTLLIVEDDRVMLHACTFQLIEAGYQVMQAMTLKEARQIMASQKLDAALLDLTLPDGDGVELVKEIRTRSEMPVLILSSNEAVSRKVECLDAGADDYLTKPADITELMARIRVHLKRARKITPPNAGLATVGKWQVNPQQYDIFSAKGKPAGLTLQEFRLLQALLKQAGKAISREALCEVLRTENNLPSPRTIDIKITRLRKKLGENAQLPEMIKTVRGIGYMLMQDAVGKHEH